MKKLAVLAGVVSVGIANAMVIDDFTTPYFNSIVGGSDVNFQVGGGIVGGERDVELLVLANPQNQFLDVAITGGNLGIVSNGFATSSIVSLQYDGFNDEVGNTGPGKFLNNVGSGAPLGLGFCNAVRIDFIGNDLKVNIQVEARLGGALIGIGNGMRAAGQGVGFEDIAMNPAALAAADSLTVRFNADPSGDFAITGIECVPEPASMAALGLGFAALVARRRRKSA